MPELLTAAELAERLQLRPETVRQWRRDGRIPAIRMTGKVIRFDLDEVLSALRHQNPEPSVRGGGA